MCKQDHVYQEEPFLFGAIIIIFLLIYILIGLGSVYSFWMLELLQYCIIVLEIRFLH